MPSLAKAYVATSATSPLQPGVVERREPGDFEVRIAIRFTGICHSDIHTARGDWAGVKYPVVVGHEIAGVVEAVGAKVTRYAVGDLWAWAVLWIPAVNAPTAWPARSSTAWPDQ